MLDLKNILKRLSETAGVSSREKNPKTILKEELLKLNIPFREDRVGNLIAFMPQILSRGLLAALIGGMIMPVVLVLKDFDVSGIKDRVYYPTAAAVSILCWVIVITNTVSLIGA